MPAPIKHVFVLMLENRSFDHLLGYLPNVVGVTPGMSNPNQHGHSPDPVPVNAGAMDRPATDPAHEFENVWRQLYSAPSDPTGNSASAPTMQGFVQSGGEETMACFAAGAVPVLQELAQTFAQSMGSDSIDFVVPSALCPQHRSMENRFVLQFSSVSRPRTNECEHAVVWVFAA